MTTNKKRSTIKQRKQNEMADEYELKIKQVVSYGGHSASANGAINLTLKASYSEMTKSMKLLQMLNNDVTLKAKLPNEKPVKLGMFRIKQVVFDDDGESVLKFNGLKDYIETDELNALPTNDSDNKEFVVMYEAEIENEDDDE